MPPKSRTLRGSMRSKVSAGRAPTDELDVPIDLATGQPLTHLRQRVLPVATDAKTARLSEYQLPSTSDAASMAVVRGDMRENPGTPASAPAPAQEANPGPAPGARVPLAPRPGAHPAAAAAPASASKQAVKPAAAAAKPAAAKKPAVAAKRAAGARSTNDAIQWIIAAAVIVGLGAFYMSKQKAKRAAAASSPSASPF